MTILFNYAFRSLFLLATLYAIVVVPLWAAAWLGVHSPRPVRRRSSGRGPGDKRPIDIRPKIQDNLIER